MIPEPARLAIHQAGHAVVQTLVGGRRSAVRRVSLAGEHGAAWRGLPAAGEALLDQEILFGLYEFGLVTLAGIAAEERYLANSPPAAEPVVALSDLAAWQEQAWRVLGDEARVALVSRNVMRRLEEWLADGAIWPVVERLAAELLLRETVEGAELQQLLASLPGRGGE